MTFNAMKSTDIFKCVQCGDCCKGYGGTFVTKKDIEAIAGYMKIDPKRFVEEYCQVSGGKPVIAQREDGYCVFWDKLCKIHAVKPRMCRQWPFIESVLVDINNWRIMAGLCPGICKDVPDAVIKACVANELST